MGYEAPSLSFRLEHHELVNGLFHEGAISYSNSWDDGTPHSEDDIYIMLLDSLATFKQN